MSNKVEEAGFSYCGINNREVEELVDIAEILYKLCVITEFNCMVFIFQNCLMAKCGWHMIKLQRGGQCGVGKLIFVEHLHNAYGNTVGFNAF